MASRHDTARYGNNPMDKKTAKIHYTYTTVPGVSLQAAHGVWGGINAQGEIEINFYNIAQ